MPAVRLQVERQTRMSTIAIKPPYVVPSMTAIAARPWNGFNAISTFSGCGGSSLGYKMAGFKVLWASEFIPAAQDTYRLNHPNTILDTRDIRQVQAEEILRTIGMSEGELDLLDGSPPCAAFSTSGSREAGWGRVKQYSDTKQRVDDLFFEFARIVKGVQPKVFVAENVSGLIKGTAKGYFLQILKALRDCGYTVEAKLLDGRWLGIPQMRQRLIFVGVRNDLASRFNVKPAFPKPLPYMYGVRDALPHIKRIRHGGNVDNWKPSTFPAGTVVQSDALTTATAYLSAGGWVETDAGERRKFTIDELRPICGFPNDFVFTGSFAQQWERMGRAVPPVMMSHIASAVRDEILCRIK